MSDYQRISLARARLEILTRFMALLLFIAVLWPFIPSFFTKVYGREMYRQQTVCQRHTAQGYRTGPCNYWNGPRP